MSNVKTVILVWTNTVCNLDTFAFWGLGDMIRGTIHLYQLSKKMKFRLIVDIQLHPLSKCLLPRYHEFITFIDDNKDNIPYISNVQSALNHSGEMYYCFTNDNYDEPITDDCKEFIKDILTPNREFETYFLEKNTLSVKSYDCIHFRLGDDELIRHKTPSDFTPYLNYLNHLDPHKTNVVFSDSTSFKQSIKTMGSNVFTLDTKIGHLGFHTDIQQIRDTLFEFFVLTQSNEIKTYSIYWWTSGFVNICNIIYNVPVTRIY